MPAFRFSTEDMLRQKGFSLLELIIVMAIIAIAGALVIPRMNNDGLYFQTQTRELIAILKYNRRMAVYENVPREVSISFHETPDQAAPHSPSGGSKSRRDKRHWRSHKINFSWESQQQIYEQNQAFSITFFPQGGATSGTITLQYAPFTSRIKVDGFTGKISLLADDDENS